MKDQKEVFSYVVTEGVDDAKKIVKEGNVLATTDKRAEKQVLADLEGKFTVNTDVLVSQFRGTETD